jgi:hypothetical protein
MGAGPLGTQRVGAGPLGADTGTYSRRDMGAGPLGRPGLGRWPLGRGAHCRGAMGPGRLQVVLGCRTGGEGPRRERGSPVTGDPAADGSQATGGVDLSIGRKAVAPTWETQGGDESDPPHRRRTPDPDRRAPTRPDTADRAKKAG